MWDLDVLAERTSGLRRECDAPEIFLRYLSLSLSFSPEYPFSPLPLVFCTPAFQPPEGKKMVTTLTSVSFLVFMTAVKYVAAEEYSDPTGSTGSPPPSSINVSRESDVTDLCREVCDLEVVPVLENDGYSAKLKGCSIMGGYHHCSLKKFHQFSLRCVDPTYSSDYLLKEYDSSENQTNCSLLCWTNSSPCMMDCDCISNAANRKRDISVKYPWHVTDIKLHCQDFKLRLMQVTAYISWKLQRTIDNDKDATLPKNGSVNKLQSDLSLKINGTSLADKQSSFPINPIGMLNQPSRYAVHICLENTDTWQEMGETNKTMMMIEHLSPNISFQVHVTGLDADGRKIGEDAVSPWIRTAEAHLTPKPIKKIWVKNIIPGKARSRKRGKYPRHEEWKLHVKISWEPNEDMLCSYGLAWFYPEGNDVKDIRPPTANFQAILKDIEYSTTYSLSIVAVYPERDKLGHLEGESEMEWLTFNTTSCEEIWNHSLTICSPPTPENITHELIPISDVGGSLMYDLKILWSLPYYATRSEGVITLTVQITPLRASHMSALDNSTVYYTSPRDDLKDAEQENHSIKEFDTLKFNVSTDTNEITIPSIVVTSNMIVAVICESEGGISKGNYYIFSPELSQSPELDISSTDMEKGVTVAVVVFVTLFAMVVFLIFVIVRKCRKQSIEKKNQYFEDVNKVKDNGNEVSGMLGEQTLGSDLEVTSNGLEVEVDSEKEVDEFEITLSRLVIKEVLGEGAFGVVYKGYYRPSRLHDVACKGNSADLSGLLSSSWEVVAVKMLRKDASVEEEKQLIHEMETLKNLGKSSHPNVVSLIGCHTRKFESKKLVLSSLMASDISDFNFSSSKALLLLVVEYCALGDLQSFLQKVWKESGLFDYFKEQEDIDVKKEGVDLTMERNVIKYINEMPPKELNQKVLKYATLDHSSSSKEDIDVECNPIIVTNQSYGIPTGLSDRKHEFGEVADAKDLTPAYLLSYARQIVMGMEFLAGHKVVHRDLAARNILLCGDGCTVKISDFGMSRDVYLQNAYHKSSAHGKLPIKWMAPEALLHRIYTTHSDVWSFGILLWEIVTLGGTPYPGISMNEVFKLLQSGYRMERPPNCSPELYQLMHWCWQERPSDRPSFSLLRSHLENLLEENSASTYLTLPVYVTEMSGNQPNSRAPSNCGCNGGTSSSSNTSTSRGGPKSFESVSDHDFQDAFHGDDQHPLRTSSLRKCSSNLTLRNEEVELGSDETPYLKNISASEDSDYLTPISASVDC